MSLYKASISQSIGASTIPAVIISKRQKQGSKGLLKGLPVVSPGSIVPKLPSPCGRLSHCPSLDP